MPENFDFLQDNKYEVGSVRNFLISANLNVHRKTYKNAFHTLYALLCALVMYVCIDNTFIGGPLAAAALFVCPAMCVFTLLYSSLANKAIATVASPIIYIAKTLFFESDVSFMSVAGNALSYFLCIACAVVLTKAVISGYTKNVVFVLITLCFAVIFLFQIILAIISIQGAFSIELLEKTVGEIYNATVNEVISFANTDEGFELYKPLLEGKEEVTKELLTSEILKIMNIGKKSLIALIPFTPSFFAVICMVYSFVMVSVFSWFAKRFGFDVFVCIMDKKWSYRPSMLSVKIYDVVFFAFLICMFISIPANISATIINLFVILTPIMFVSGIRCIYGFAARKSSRKVLPAIIIAIVIIISLSLLGPLTFFIASSVGITFMIKRDKDEKAIMPLKIADDMATFNQFYANTKDNQNTEN